MFFSPKKTRISILHEYGFSLKAEQMLHAILPEGIDAEYARITSSIPVS